MFQCGTGIGPERDLFVSRVIQHVVVDVNDEGTVDAAANADAYRTPEMFTCDHPVTYRNVLLKLH